MNKKISFNVGDVVVTLKDEQDIERIPKGTPIRLTGLNSPGLWKGHGKINGVTRNLLVYESNLAHAFD